LDVTREMKKTVHRYGALLWLLNPNFRLTSPAGGRTSNSPWQKMPVSNRHFKLVVNGSVPYESLPP